MIFYYLELGVDFSGSELGANVDVLGVEAYFTFGESRDFGVGVVTVYSIYFGIVRFCHSCAGDVNGNFFVGWVEIFDVGLHWETFSDFDGY